MTKRPEPTSVGGLSLLTEMLVESDPVEEVKHRVVSVSLIVWFIHRWQQSDFDDLKELFKKETNLTQAQIRAIGKIKKKSTEPEILRCVTRALDNPYATGESDASDSDQ